MYRNLIFPLIVGIHIAGCNSTPDPEPVIRYQARFSTPVHRMPRSQLKLDQKASLTQYLQYAALNNPGLEAAFNRWKAALERVPQVSSLPDPRFTYGYFIEEVETRAGPQQHKFALSQMVPWFGKLGLRGTEAAQHAHAALQEFEKAKRELFYRVKQAYCEYWYLARAVEVIEKHLKLLQTIEQVALTRFKAGTAPHSVVIQVQVELGKLEDQLHSLKAMKRPLAAKLNAALNRRLELELPWPETLPKQPVSFTREQAAELIKKHNPDLQRLKHLIRKEEAGVALAKKEYLPDITFGIEYIETDNALVPGTPDSGKDPIMATASINLPIWFGKYRAGEREAKYRRTSAEKKRADAGNRLQADLEFAFYRLRDAERKVQLYTGTLIPIANESFLVAQKSFEAGRAAFVAVIDAERLLLEFKREHYRAQADREQRAAEIEMLTGTDLHGVASRKPLEERTQK